MAATLTVTSVSAPLVDVTGFDDWKRRTVLGGEPKVRASDGDVALEFSAPFSERWCVGDRLTVSFAREAS